MKTQIAEATRAALTGILQSLNSAAAMLPGGDMSKLEEPFASAFKNLHEQCSAVLGKMPTIHQASTALELEAMLSHCASALGSAQATLSLFTNHVASLNQKLAAATDQTRIATQLASAVDAEIAARVEKGDLITSARLTELKTSGELVEKTVVQELCSASKKQGLEEGAAAEQAKLAAEKERARIVDSRKTLCEQASLPVPPAELEAVLAGTEDEFNAARTAAASRVEVLKKNKMSVQHLASAVWGNEAAWRTVESAIAALPGKTQADITAVPPAATPAPGKRVIGAV